MIRSRCALLLLAVVAAATLRCGFAALADGALPPMVVPDVRRAPAERVVPVRWMQDLDTVLPHVEPGTHIELAGGVHRPQVIRGLRGTAEKPIVIRGAPGERVPIFSDGEIGLHLIDVEHVVLDGIAFRNQSTAALRISSAESGTRHVQLRHIHVLGVRGDTADGIVLDGVADLSLLESTVHNWGSAALRIRDASNVSVRGLRTLNFGHRTRPFGVVVAGSSQDIDLNGLRLEHRIGVGIAIGDVADAEARLDRPRVDGAASGGPALRIAVRNSFIVGTETTWRIGSADGVRFERCTAAHVSGRILDIVAPEASRDAPGQRPTATSLTIDRCLFDWSRVAIQELVRGDAAETIRLGPNLWFGGSGESTRAALRAAGALGLAAADEVAWQDQVVDLDPELDQFGRPEAAGAKEFGARGPELPAATGPSP